MGILGKSSKEIAQRRDVKCRVVEMLVECAEIAPLAIKASNKLSGEQTGRITLKAGGFWVNLSQSDKLVCRTAKGSSTPARHKHAGYKKLADFLSVPTLTPDEAGCMAAWTELGVLWAKHLVERNPHTFPNGWREFQNRIDTAANAVEVSNEDYIDNPYGKGEPRNADQAFAYMIFKAGYINSYEYSGKPKLAESEWKKLLQQLPKELQTPNIKALVEKKGFQWAVKKCNEKYNL